MRLSTVLYVSDVFVKVIGGGGASPAHSPKASQHHVIPTVHIWKCPQIVLAMHEAKMTTV